MNAARRISTPEVLPIEQARVPELGDRQRIIELLEHLEAVGGRGKWEGIVFLLQSWAREIHGRHVRCLILELGGGGEVVKARYPLPALPAF